MRLDGPSPQKVLLRGMPFAGHAGALPRCCVARLRGLYCGAGDRPLSIKTASSPYGASASSYQSNSKVTSRLRQGCPARCPPRPRPRVFGAIRACAKGPIRFEIQMGRPAAHAPKGLGRFGLVRFEVQPFPTRRHPRAWSWCAKAGCTETGGYQDAGYQLGYQGKSWLPKCSFQPSFHGNRRFADGIQWPGIQGGIHAKRLQGGAGLHRAQRYS